MTDPGLCEDRKTIVEVCLDGTASAVAAEEGGADRVELCSGLAEGGLTPSAGSIRATRSAITVGLQVMIRPRGGDFCYDAHETAAMAHDIAVARDLGADGVVLGALRPDGTVDEVVTGRLVEAASSRPVTFHRAFDMCRDPHAALETLVGLGVTRVLTSGQEASVPAGRQLIAALVRQAGNRIVVMPGCGLTPENVVDVVRATGVREVHVVGSESRESAMRFRNPRVFMGVPGLPEYTRAVTTATAVRAYVDALAVIGGQRPRMSR